MRQTKLPVQVRSRFEEGHWSRGFEIAEVLRREDHELYRVRRRSDGTVLPALFPPDDIRPDQD